MREIRFRGFSISTKKWVYGYLWIVPGVNLYYILTGKINMDCSIEKYEVCPESIGQFTGLKDKNGVEIYEGDIIPYEDTFDKCVGIVKFGQWEQDGPADEYGGTQCLGFYIERIKAICDKSSITEEPYVQEYLSKVSLVAENIEVIGDIYRNKELLEGKQNV